MPTALKRPSGKSGCCPDSPAPTPTCRSSGFRRCHSMSRTWMPCVRSPIRLLRSATMRAAQRPDEEPANQALQGSACNKNVARRPPAGAFARLSGLRAFAAQLAGAAAPALFEEFGPRCDVGVLPQESPALTLGHTPPNAKLDLVVQRVRAALLHYRAVAADHCGLTLRGPPHKELVWVSSPAQCLGYPGDPFFSVDAV